MPQLRFDQFQKLLFDAEVASQILLPATRAAMTSYRLGRLSRVDEDEEAYKQIYDDAYATAGLPRVEHKNPKSEVGTPNLSRHEKLRASNTSPSKREEAEVIYFFLQFDEVGSEYADPISAELFKQKTFYQQFHNELRKLRVDIPRTGDPEEIFHIGGIKVRLTAAPDGRPLTIPPSNSGSIFEGENIVPSEALKWQNLVSDIFGRDEESDAIKDWADDGALDAKVHLLSGPGGVGKTRLAASMARRLPEWHVGFLPSDVNTPELDVEFRGGGIGTLMIIDYPEERPRLVEALFRTVAEGQKYATPVRFLLVSRERKAAWRDFPGARSIVLTSTPLELNGPLKELDALKVVESVLDFFSSDQRIQRVGAEGAKKWLAEDATNRKPLNTIAATVHALISPDSAFKLGSRDVMLALAELELSRIRRFSNRNFPRLEGLQYSSALETLLCLGLFHDRGIGIDVLYELGQRDIVPGIRGHDLLKRVVETPFWRREEEFGQSGYLMKPEPDILGAALLYSSMLSTETPKELSNWIVSILKDSGDAFVGNLSRLLFDLSTIDQKASLFLEDVAVTTIKAHPSAVVHLSDSLFRQSSIFSTHFQKILLETAISSYQRFSVRHRASLKANLAITLIKLSDFEEGLRIARESHELVQDNIDDSNTTFDTELATSLTNLSGVLSELQLWDEAAPLADDAIRICRKRPVDLHTNILLATALNNRGGAYFFLEVWQEARIAFQEAHDIYCDLEDAKPGFFLSEIARSNNNLSGAYSRLGLELEALNSIRKACNQYRLLSQRQPELFLPDLAMSLNNSATALSDAGFDSEALIAAEDSVKIYEELARARPTEMTHDLAMSLHTFGVVLSNQGHSKDAHIRFYDAIKTVLPAFVSDPQGRPHDTAALFASYIRSCSALHVPPDPKIANPIFEIVGLPPEDYI